MIISCNCIFNMCRTGVQSRHWADCVWKWKRGCETTHAYLWIGPSIFCVCFCVLELLRDKPRIKTQELFIQTISSAGMICKTTWLSVVLNCLISCPLKAALHLQYLFSSRSEATIRERLWGLVPFTASSSWTFNIWCRRRQKMNGVIIAEVGRWHTRVFYLASQHPGRLPPTSALVLLFRHVVLFVK